MVTGGAGYVGSHLLKEILKQPNATIVSIDKEKSSNQKYIKKAIFINGDIGDKSRVLKMLKKYKIDIVIHLAAYINIEESMRKPVLYFKNNVVAGLNLLGAMREAGIKKIIYSSSAAVYDSSASKRVKENDPLKPANTYGLTKTTFENVISSYSKIYGFDYIILRLFNVAGADPEGELKESHRPETHLIPRVLHSIFSKKPVVVYGNDYNTPDATCLRDYVHVNDVSQTFIKAIPVILKSHIAEVFNIGSGKARSVLDVIDACEKITNRKAKICWADRREGDPATLVANCGKAKKFLGWKAKYDLEDMVRHAINSLYKSNPE